MTVFSASFSAVAISAAQDLFEIVAPSDSRIRLLEIDIGQYSDFGAVWGQGRLDFLDRALAA